MIFNTKNISLKYKQQEHSAISVRDIYNEYHKIELGNFEDFAFNILHSLRVYVDCKAIPVVECVVDNETNLKMVISNRTLYVIREGETSSFEVIDVAESLISDILDFFEFNITLFFDNSEKETEEKNIITKKKIDILNNVYYIRSNLGEFNG